MSELAQDKKARGRWLRSPWILISVASVGLFAFAYWQVLDSFRAETAQRTLRYAAGSGEGADAVRVEVSVAHIDPAKEVLALRAKLVPRGIYADSRKRPSRPLRMRINGYRGPVEHLYKSGRRVGSVEASLQLHGGDIADYPLDSYRANFSIELDEGPSSPGPGGTRLRTPKVPVRIAFTGGIHGMRLSSRLSEQSRDGLVLVRLGVERSSGTVFFAFIVMGIMAVLTVLVISVSAQILYTGRRPEVNLFGWMGGMLFAFPAIRNALPGAPPIGSLIDYLVFFWAEGFVALVLVVTVTTWLARRPS